MILKFILSIFVILFVISITPAYAQHHSGSLSPPIDLDGLQVAVSTTLFPEDFSYGDSKSTNLSIRFFDSETDVNIQSCLLYTSPSPRDRSLSRMPSSA